MLTLRQERALRKYRARKELERMALKKKRFLKPDEAIRAKLIA